MSRAIESAVEKHKGPIKELSAQEEQRLEQLETVVIEKFRTFVQVGQALAEIRDRKLYRMKAMIFEKYCKDLFDIAKSRVHQLIGAAEVLENFHSCGSFPGEQKMMPINEAQIRPLTRLNQVQQVAVWKAVLESAPKGKITASYVNRMVKTYIGDKVQTSIRQAQKRVRQMASAAFAEAFENFTKQISEERNSNYKHTSRGFIIQHLDQLRAELAEDGELIEEPAFRGGSSDANKLERAGYSLFRADRTSRTIKRRDNGGWVKYSGPFVTIKEMEGALDTLLQDDMNLRG